MTKNDEFVFMWSLTPNVPGTWASADALNNRSDIYVDADILYYFNGEVITSYMRESHLEEQRKKYSPLFLNPNYFAKYREKYLAEKRSWWKWIRKIEKKDYTNISKPELKKDHQQFTVYIRDAIAYFGSTRTEFTYAAEQKLEEIIRNHFGNKWPKVFGTLTTATEIDDVQKEHLDWLKLIEQNPDDRKLLKHASSYPWLVFGQLDEEKVINFFRERIKDTEKVTYRNALIGFDKKKEELTIEQESVYEKLGKDAQEAKYLAGFLQTQSVERMNIKAYWAGCNWLARNLLKTIAETLKIDLDDFMAFVFPPDIQSLLEGTFEQDIYALIQIRKEYYAFKHKKGNGVRILNGKDARKVFEETIQIQHDNEKPIKGQVASLGKYSGRVRKIIAGDLEMLRGSIKLFQEGEVLVTSMTQPNMMVIARKAGAIVTDEGGITSHAAIISRELGIPCIVGCLHAMESLNNGDMVEVDAEKGIVKIIQKD